MNWNMAIAAGVVLGAILTLKRISFVSPEFASKLIEQGALVVDVRSEQEFQSGHVRDAVNSPLGKLREALPRRVTDRSQVLLLHCLSGGRSLIAKLQLKRLGYKNVFNLGSYRRAQRIVDRGRKNIV